MDANIRPITLFFTDLESSTRLWEEYPCQMARALARHDALASEIVERYRGRLVRSVLPPRTA